MWCRWIFVALLLVTGRRLGAQAPVAVAAREMVRHAARAITGDSVPSMRARWATRAARGDRLARLGLATIARLSYDYADADARYAALFAAGANDPVAIYARLGMATAADARGRLALADTLFRLARRAAAGARDRAAEAAALGGLAMERGPTQGAPAALATLDSADRLVPHGDTALAADLAVRHTIFLAVMSRPEAGREGFRARDLARAADDPQVEGRALRAIALDLHLRGKDDSAVTVLEEAERVQRAAHDHSTLAETLIRHGDVYHSRGEIARFKQLLEQAVVEARIAKNQYALNAASVGLGVVALDFGDFAGAERYLGQAEQSARAAGDSGGMIIVRAYQANCALAEGDLPRAARLALAVRAFHHATGDASEEFGALRTLAEVSRRQGDYARAAAWLDTAATLSRKRNRAWDISLLYDGGALALARGDYKRAAGLLANYLSRSDTADHVLQHEARELMAEAHARLGDMATAERELRASDDEIDAWRATLTDRELRTTVFQLRAHDADALGSSAAVVIAALAAGGQAEAAFPLAEHRRARELADRLMRASALAGGSGAELKVGAGSRSPSASANGLAAAEPLVADGRTALLEFVTGSGAAPTTLFVITTSSGADHERASVRAYVIPSADTLAPLIARLDALIESRLSPRPLERQLGAVLLDSAIASLAPSVTRLIVVPDGPLHRVPFDALRMADDRFIVQRFSVSTVPSAAVLTELRRRGVKSGESGATQLLAFGDPAFAAPAFSGSAAAATSSDEGRDFRSAFDATGGLPRLTASGDEARIVGSYATDAVVRLGADASAFYLKHAALGDFGIIHFATHALVDDNAATHTALALAPGGGESGFVSPGDLAALRLNAGLVVLSACRTAGGVVIDGEGVQGLTAPLLEAGARSVVATQWRVGDRATVPFVLAFYDAMSRGSPVGDALRAAKLDAIRRGAPPAEWAAFVTVGDPSVRIPLHRRAPISPLLALFGVIVLLGAVVTTVQYFRSRPRAA